MKRLLRRLGPRRIDDHFRTDHLDKGLRRRAVRGGITTIGSQVLKAGASVATTAVLGRLLTPGDFGLIAMVAAVTGLVGLMKDLGLSQATVQRAEINHGQVSTLFWVNVLMGALCTLVVSALAPALAWFYGEARLTGVALALAWGFLIGGSGVQHIALLRRHMRYTNLALNEVGSLLVGSGVAITMSALGAGYWSLVAMPLAVQTTSTLAAWVSSGWRPGPPVRGAGVRSMLAFGGYVSGANLANYLSRNTDNVLIGWRWGAEPLGLYSRAYQLMLLPVKQINAPVSSVAVPALSRLQHQPERFRSFYKKAMLLMVSFGVPIVAFGFVAAEEIVALLLGPNWGGAVPLFRMMMPAAVAGTVNVATGWVYVALGQSKRHFLWAVGTGIVNVAGFAIATPFGPEAVALSFSLTFPLTRLAAMTFGLRGTPLRPRDLLESLWRPFVASGLAGTGLWFVKAQWGAGLHPAVGLAGLLAAFGPLLLVAWAALPGGFQEIRLLTRLRHELKAQRDAGKGAPSQAPAEPAGDAGAMG